MNKNTDFLMGEICLRQYAHLAIYFSGQFVQISVLLNSNMGILLLMDITYMCDKTLSRKINCNM